MKKILTILSLLLLGTLFSACGKVPFAQQKTESSAALVYIYIESDTGVNDNDRMPKYTIGINSKDTKESMETYEYKYFYLKEGKTTVSATRAELEVQKLELSLEAGKTYYLRVRSFSDDFGKFDIVEVNEEIALKALKNTNLVGEYKKTEIISEIITPKEKSTQIDRPSKVEELKSALQLKNDGVLSDEEFKTLKAEILAK